MRVALLCLFVLAVFASAGARSARADDGGWTRVYSHPAPTIYDIEMADDNVGLALTAAGILRTDDGGRTWKEPYPIAEVTYGDVSFANKTRAWAVAGSGVIRRTDDAGLTWQSQNSGTGVRLHHIAIVNANEAWVTGQGEGFDDSPRGAPPSVLLHTTDGGATWRNDPVAGYGQYLNVAFVGRTGWLVASPCAAGEPFDHCNLDKQTFLRTVDGGRTWKVLSKAPGVVPERMQWLDAKRGFATSFILTDPAGDSGIFALYRTSDGGERWTRIESAPAENTYEIHFQSERDGWITANFCPNAFECYPSTWHTTDGGGRWTSAPAPVGGGENFAVTGNAVLLGMNPRDPPVSGIARLDLHTKQWSAAETAARQALRAIDFVDRNHGYALSGSRLLSTEDGGVTWSLRDSPPYFDSIDAVDGDAIWAATICCSEAGAVFRSLDGAKTWQERPAPFGQPLAVQAFDADRAIVSSSNDGLWRTDDGGGTWRQIDTIAYGYGPLTFIDAQHGWSMACVIYLCRDVFRITDDGGATWEVRPLPAGASVASFLTAEVGWATRVDCAGTGIDCGTVIFSTGDGGRTWQEAGRAPWALNGLTFVSPTQAWATTFDPNGRIRIVATTDSGQRWGPAAAVDGTFPTAFAKTADRIWLLTAVGFQGGSDRSTIYRRDFAPEPAPPPAKPRVRPPNTGSGGQGGDTEYSTVVVLLSIAGVLAVGAWALVKRRGA